MLGFLLTVTYHVIYCPCSHRDTGAAPAVGSGTKETKIMTLTHTQTKTQTRDVEDMVNTAPSLTIDVPAGASEARMVINNRINALHPDNYEIRDYPTGDGWSFFVYGPNYTHVYNLKGN